LEDPSRREDFKRALGERVHPLDRLMIDATTPAVELTEQGAPAGEAVGGDDLFIQAQARRAARKLVAIATLRTLGPERREGRVREAEITGLARVSPADLARSGREPDKRGHVGSNGTLELRDDRSETGSSPLGLTDCVGVAGQALATRVVRAIAHER